MIQGIVTRMASNSFLLKGWSVTLVSTLVGLSAYDRRSDFVALAYFPAVAFWLLDGYFLYQERLFRELYNRVRKSTNDEVDFAMSVEPGLVKQISATLSPTISLFYGGIFVGILWIMLAMGSAA